MLRHQKLVIAESCNQVQGEEMVVSEFSASWSYGGRVVTGHHCYAGMHHGQNHDPKWKGRR